MSERGNEARAGAPMHLAAASYADCSCCGGEPKRNPSPRLLGEGLGTDYVLRGGRRLGCLWGGPSPGGGDPSLFGTLGLAHILGGDKCRLDQRGVLRRLSPVSQIVNEDLHRAAGLAAGELLDGGGECPLL